MVLVAAVVTGYFKWVDTTARETQEAGRQAVQVARESTVALLSYHPDTADRELFAVRARLGGTFLDDYTKLVNEVVIPGAKQK